MKRLPNSMSLESIKDVWKTSRDSKRSAAGSPGVDKVTADQFGSNLSDNISDLRHEVRAGRFRFNRLRIAPVQKEKGGYRIIAVPTVRDRLLQRVLLKHLEDDVRFNACSSISYGFNRGRTLNDAYMRALDLRAAHPWILQTDIVKFFDEIPRSTIKEIIKRKVRVKIVADLLCSAVDSELDDGDGHGALIARQNGIRRGRGLRQGMPVSPMLSNLLLREFDAQIVARGLSAIRYADDIIIFSDSKNECRDAFGYISEALSALGLRIPKLESGDKTVISGPSDVVEFLGLDIKRVGKLYELAIPFRKLKKIELDMAEIASVERCIKDRRKFNQVERTLESFIIGHTAAMSAAKDCSDFVARAERQKQKRIEKLLGELIGDDALRKLNQSARAILGLQPFELNHDNNRQPAAARNRVQSA